LTKRIEIIDALGHELIRSTHRTTFEVTKDRTLTARGDCIIAVGADKGAADLSEDFKKLTDPNQKVRITLTVETQ